MPTTIQTIHKPTRARGLDASGNNNHAQIYSGRGLEFDGVADYLECFTALETTHPFFVLANDFTVALWLKVNTAGDDTVFYATNNDNSSRVGLNVGAEGEIAFTTWNGSIYTHASGGGNDEEIIHTSTWYRVVCTCSNNTLKLYLNGILQTGTTTAHSGNLASTNSNRLRIGEKNSVYFDGCLSDFQVWNSVFSQNDVTYDYLNPEQLALNRGGTSLTNSNLKLWYPMNEGHRGNQSYVLDASNTGVGDDIVNWSSTFNASGTSTDDFGSWTTNANDSTTFCTFDHNNKTIRIRTTDSTHIQAFYVPEILKYGTTYKFEYTVSEIKSGSVRVRPQNTTEYLSASEVGTYSYIVSPENSTTDLDFRIERHSSEATDVTISDVKIFPINDKHSATTVFYGDELVTEGDFSNGGAAWSDSGGTITTAINGGAFVSTGDADGGFGTCQQAETLVAGRTYKLTFDVTAVTGSPSVHNYCDSLTKSLGTASITSFSDTFVSDGTGGIDVRTICSNGQAVTVDNISLKEVGVASGWTDADQQLDIPQTALQSYNQLGFSYGSEDSAGGAISCGAITSGAWTTLDIWFFPHKSGYNQGLLDQIAWNGDDGDSSTGGYGFRVTISSTDKIVLTRRVSGTNTSNTMTSTNKINIGKWNHVAVVIPKNTSTSMRMMVNGHYEQTNSSGDHGNTSKDFRLGYGGGIHYDSMPGCIAQASYFKEHMSETQMLELYNEGTPIDSRNHSVGTDNLAGYWRNNGIYGNTWTNLANPGTNDGTPQSLITETMLITAGVDSSRDSQGFFMNRPRTTNSLNNNTIIDGDIDRGAYSKVETHPLYTGSAVTNYSISFWMKIGIKPSDFLTSGNSFSLFDTTISNSIRAFRASLNHNNILYMYTYYGTSAGNESVYCDYDLDSLSGSIVNPPTAPNNGIGEAFDPNKWYHVTWTFDHDRTTGSGNADNTNAEDHNFTPYFVYINGIQVAAEGREGANSAMTTARSMLNSNVPMIIGSDMATSGNPSETSYQDFPGEIDDVCFYSDTLTDEEVLRNYNAGKRSHK